MNRLQKDKKLMVTKPLLPPLEELTPFLEHIWQSGNLTNGGPFCANLEMELCRYLGVKNISLCSSGTLALTIALKSLNLKGEIITTPFTHIATAQAIHWNNLTPVFVDIDKSSLNIDVTKIEKAIGPETSAILPVHIFGNPCAVKKINKLAEKYNLKVVYDGAHSFGVQLNGNSICNFGDLTVLSFHATKVFNCIEGGAVISHDKSMKKCIDALKNTGLNNNHQITGYGLNAKMNEIQAAYGSVLLKHINNAIENRKSATRLYRKLLKKAEGITLINIPEIVKYNYAYFPIIINPAKFGAATNEVINYLKENNIFTKRYFYPLVTDFDKFRCYKSGNLNFAENISKNIICLPLSHEINSTEIEFIVNLLLKLQKRRK